MTTHLNPDQTQSPQGQGQDPHRSLHSETGARPGEHPGRSRNPLVKVAGLAWLEFEKPDLDRAERFGTDFGFTVADRTPETVLLRGRRAAAACLVIRRGPQPRFAGVTFRAAARDDLDRLARGTGGTVMAHWGGHAVRLRDPSGYPVHVVYGIPDLPALPERAPLPLNFGTEPVRANATQRPARQPAEIQRLGHVALGTTRFRAALDWYLDVLGLIVSDFLYLDGQRDRGPAMAFIRCDLGSVPADHHTLAMALMPQTGYLHSAYELTDLDEVAASGEYLREHGTGTRGAWAGTSRAARSSTTGVTRTRRCSSTTPTATCSTPRWNPAGPRCRSAAWPSGARRRLRSSPAANDPRVVVAAIKALRDKGNEVDLRALRGLIKAMSS